MISKIILTAVDEPLARAWETHCGDLAGVEVYRGSILDVECDAIVSPANSFGFMDGGVDLVYLRHFGLELQEKLRADISRHYRGELPVGSAAMVNAQRNPTIWLIAAPTMRVPMRITGTVNAYLAARAALLKCEENIAFATIAFPGMGTGIGGLDPFVCARQVFQAIRDHREQPAMPSSWLVAKKRHEVLAGTYQPASAVPALEG